MVSLTGLFVGVFVALRMSSPEYRLHRDPAAFGWTAFSDAMDRWLDLSRECTDNFSSRVKDRRVCIGNYV